ncbi:S8 family serine peptidase [Lysobacter sp. N42]|uniref:S8 family peptidase n=1 Tax=Lysobacter sp. N42 TaxID=2545719 RepID=UPI001042A64F|nr:S8 family serine peptidase [Lysobacter sp. N42]TCZ88141.1 peptidase S8 [Lysobacter sp. N42]
MSAPKSRTPIRLSALAAGLLLSGVALADAHLDPQLVNRLLAASPADELGVVVTYRQSGPVTGVQLQALKALGIDKGRTMRTLPIAGVLATPAEIQALAKRDDVVSIYWNAPLRYFNKEQREMSGAARVVANPADFLRAIPFSGKGVGVVVNDSGIDATHEDLKLGEHVVQNVLAPQNVLAEVARELVPGLVPITYLEGVPNTDLGSGHGTHCAGSVGGTGERSNGLFRGAAPGASIVGYGSGAVLFVLDAVGGLDYAATNQFSFRDTIRVVSNSWGSSGKFDPLNPVNIATYELYKRGIVSVFAAGNDGAGEDTHNPYAQAPWVISVGAGEKDGVLTSFSSRGKRGETGTFTMPDGRTWTYVNEPTIVATGVDIISTRANTGALPALAATQDVGLAPEHLPFYSYMSGTSMATPHVAGVIALMLEANPNLTPAQVKDIIQRTATNMTGRLPWEAGFGHLNAYAAVAEAAGVRSGWGATPNALRTFNANALTAADAAPVPFSLQFLPVGPLQDFTFEVGADVAWVAARATIGENTLAIALVDPDGNRYGSSIALPLLGDTVTAGAPGKPGTWRVQVRGIGSVSGVALDPTGSTNGVGLPGTVDGQISFVRSAGYTGMNDVASHPARGAIEFAVAHRLVDGHSDRQFRPDATLKRIELAQYLMMGQNIRQHLPFNGRSSFSDMAAGSTGYAFAEAVAARGGALRDLAHSQDPVMGTVNGAFRPNDAVTRVSLAYSLVQSMALQNEARAFSGELTAFYDGKRVPVADASSIPAPLRGYVQLALDLGLINARFAVTQGPYDLQPTLRAYFDPSKTVTRADFAVAAGRYLTAYQSAED